MKNKNLSLFTVSFRQGFISPNVPIASFKQGNKTLNFLLDTGSENNVINESALQFIEHEMLQHNEGKVTLSGVGGTTEVGHCAIKFKCGEEEYKPTFLVTDLTEAFSLLEQEHSIILHGILGSLFLKEHNVVLDFTKFVAYSKP